MFTCTFAGHRQLFEAGVDRRVDAALERLIRAEREILFLSGGMGEFDRLCERAVRRLRARHPDARVRLVLVLPRLTRDINENRALYASAYDGVLVPEELTGVHFKRAISMRNRWMVDRSQALLFYVLRDFGGAWAALQYARRRPGLCLIDLAAC